MTSTDQTTQVPLPSGLGATLRLLAALIVLAFAGLGALVVLDVIPITRIAEAAIKLGLLSVIAGAAVVAISLLLPTARR